MEMMIKLFIIFAKLSLFSFGGGFVMVPVAMKEFEENGLTTAAQLTDAVALATMSPGPVGVNLAVALGYKVGGIAGMFSSFIGITLPTTILVICVALFFFKIYKNHIVKSAFYGLRPVITGVIMYAAISLALKNGMVFANPEHMITKGINIIISGLHILEIKSILIAISVFILLIKTKTPPIFVIIISGILGMIIF